MASLKNFFNDEPNIVPEPPMKTADDYVQPELESLYEGLRQAGVSPEAGQRSIDMTRRLAGTVIPPPEGESPSDWAKIQAASKGSDVTSPIPTASAPVKADVPSAVKTAIPATTATRPAPPADGSGGDDDVRNLYLARLAAQSAAGFGGMGAGKNIDMGIADTLGERMKQVEALRAKKAEKAEEQTGFKTANLGFLGGYRDVLAGRGDLLPGFKALEEAASVMPPDKFAKAVRDWSMTPSTIRGKEAGIAKTEAQTKTEEVKPEVARGGLEVKRGTLAERERSNKANEEIRRKAILAKQLSDTKANNDVRAAGSDPKQAEKAITDAMKSAEKKDLGIVSNIRDFQGLEAVAPGFTQGKVPSWLGQGSIAAAIKVPGLNKQATQLASALELFTAGIRNSLFGASLTGNEKESFDAIVSSGLMMPPDVLAANINRIRQGAAKFAQNHFTVAQELHPEVTGRVLGASTIFGPALGKGGIYSDVWTLPVSPAAGGNTPVGMVKVKHSSGRTTTVDRATADQMIKDDPANFSEVK